MKRLGLILACLSLVSCQGVRGAFEEIARPNMPDTQAEGGRVYISTYPPIAWSEIASDLNPNFDTKSADALLAKVLPTTLADEINFRRGVSAGLDLSLAGTSVTKTDMLTQTTDPADASQTEAERQFERKRTLSPGERPDTDVTTPPFALQSGLGTSSTGMDPFLQYRAATALYQEIIQLNSYLTTSFETDGQDAYLFRSRITVHPFARRQPIDVYSRIFFGPEIADSNRGKDECGYGEAIRVVPLLLTDNFERSDTRRLAEAVEQLSFNLSAMSAGNGLGAGLSSLKDELKQLRGVEYNNLQSVAQMHDSKLIVRFGAGYSGGSNYDMRPQTYDISYLVLVKRACEIRTLKVRESSVFRDARNGELLRDTSLKYKDKLEKELRNRLTAWKFSPEGIEKAVTLFNNQQFYQLKSNWLRKKDGASCPAEEENIDSTDCARINDYPSLYDFVDDIADTLRISSVTVTLPEASAELPPQQIATAIDVANGTTTVRIGGGKRLSSSRSLRAVLVPSDTKSAGCTCSTGYPNGFEALDYAFDKNGVLAMKFPSISAYGLKSDNLTLYVGLPSAQSPYCPAKNPPVSSDTDTETKIGGADTGKAPTLSATPPGSTNTSESSDASDEASTTPLPTESGICTYNVVLDRTNSKPAAKPGVFTPTPFTTKLVIDKNNEGELRLLIKATEPQTIVPAGYLVTVTGAVLKSTSAPAFPAATVTPDLPKNAVRISAPVLIELHLSNLVADEEVQITVEGLDAAGKPLKTIEQPGPLKIKLVKGSG